MRQGSQKTAYNFIKTLFQAIKCLSSVFYSGRYLKFAGVSILIFTLTVGHYYLWAADDPTAITVETVKVFPDTVEGEGWHNVGAVRNQDVSADAIYQDFSILDSAYPRASWGQPEDQGTEADEDTGVSTPATNQLTGTTTEPAVGTTSDTTASEDEESTATDEVDEAVAEEPEVEDESIEPAEAEVEEPTPTETEPTAASAVIFGLPFAQVDTSFSLAQAELVSSTIPVEATTTEIMVEIDEPTATTTPDVVSSSTPIALPATTTDEVVSSSDPVVVATSTATSTDATGATTTPETPEVALVVPGCSNECVPHTMELSGFGVPLVDGVELAGAQLRVSFAGKRKDNETDLQALTLRYSFDDGRSWNVAGQIVIDDEASNGLNGGYYLFALPQISDPSVLDTLKVELAYAHDVSLMEGVFIESAWLELLTIERPDLFDTYAALLEDDGFDERVLSGDELAVSENKTITFTNTDDNSGETLIIKSDETTYNGLTKAVTYFNVTNTSNREDTFSVQTYFPNGVGEVTELSVWNQNKPRTITVPEYRPFVYHCDGGWEETDLPEQAPTLHLDSAVTLSEEARTETVASSTEEVAATSSTEADVATSTDLVSSSTESVIDEMGEVEASTSSAPAEPVEALPVATSSELLSLSTVLGASTTVATTSSGTDVSNRYLCPATGAVRTCDTVDGDDTACRVDNVLLDEHDVTQYTPGWDTTVVAPGEPSNQATLFDRAKTFLGLGPDTKYVPSTFEVRSHTPDTYQVAPGETKYFRMEITFPAFSRGEFWIEAIGNREYGLLDPFWSSEWTYRMPIQIDNTNGVTDLTEHQVFFELDSSISDFWANVAEDGSDIRFIQEARQTNFSNADTAASNWDDFAWAERIPIVVPATATGEDLNNFPVSVNLNTLDSAFWSGVRSDGGDIRVTTSDGTEVPIDVAEINVGMQYGDLHFLAPTIATNAANTFYLYYNNPTATGYAATDPLGSQAVWAGYEAVYHFYDDVSTLGNEVTDETGNGYDVAVTSVTLATTSGQFGSALDLTAGAGYLATTTWLFPGGDPLIVTGSYYQTALSNEALFQWGTGAQPDRIEYRPWYNTNNGLFYFGATAGAAWSNTNRATTTWHSFGLIGTTSAADNNYVYEDGVLIDTIAQTVANPNNTNTNGFQIGRQGSGGSWNGLVDELRIATTTRRPAWVIAESNNLFEPDSFYEAQAAQTPGNAATLNWYSTSWEARQKFSVSPASIDDDLTDFPVYVDLSTLGSNFFSRVATDGADIRITEGDGVTELPYELVAIDTGAETGELHFKATLSDSNINDFYVYFDNEDAAAYAAGDTYGSENVWTNGFLAVYHFEEDAAGTGNTNLYTDSTSNDYHGDDETTSNDTTGQLGQGVELGDDANDHIDLPSDVLDGETDLTTSWWHNTTVATDQVIVSGAFGSGGDSNEFIMYLDNLTQFDYWHSNANEPFTLDNSATYNDGTWQHFMATGEDSSDEVNLYFNGVGDTENPDPQPIDALTIANGGLVVGQEQDTLGGGFQDTQNFEGQLDELRFANVIRTESWAAAEYANQSSPSTFYATSSVETITSSEFVELDFWLKYFSTTTSEAEIWVQVDSLPAGEKTVIYMYYGNSGATSASDELATFSYSTSTDLYYVVDGSGVDQVSVQSLIDNNQVSIDGGAPVSLDQGEVTTFGTAGATSVISALGPLSGTVRGPSSDGSDSIAPISFATTSFAVPTNRSPNRWYVYAPFASTTVNTYIGNSGTPDQTLFLATGTAATATADPADPGTGVDGDGVVIEATSPILATHRHTTPGDGLVLYPPTKRDLFGVNSNNIFVSALVDDPDPTVTCSGGGGPTTFTGVTRGEKAVMTTCTTGSEGAGDAVRLYDQVEMTSAIQLADSDGNEATMFWPQYEFGTQYGLSNSGAYIAVVCSPRYGEVDLEVRDSTGSLIEAGTCTPSGDDPGKAYFTNGTGDGDSANFAAGTQVVATNGVPFYAIYEDVSDDQDEKNILGSIQARKYDAGTHNYTFGAQEMANDAQYEQRSYLWYQNGDVLTPTTTWAISTGEFVSEGEGITGAGAVGTGDVLRLRMSTAISNATSSAGSEAFTLQYTTADIGQCSAATDWADVGEIGSTTAAFAGYNNTSVGDGTRLATTTLASSTVLGTYEERNFSDFIPEDFSVNEVIEWDWVITATNITVNQNYCFRMVRASGATFAGGYTTYPELETVGPPDTPTLLVYFDNERANAFDSVLEFTTTDIAGDDIHYQVQIDDDYNFGSVEVDRNSDDNFLEFENLNTPSDKAPFNSGAQVRFTSPTTLSATTTYWWRVRASDPTGSATSSDWSAPFSFTTSGTTTVSEWYQTTGDQFNTNELVNVSTTTGGVSMTASPGTMTGTSIDFDDATVGNAWGEVLWSDTETSGTSTIQVQYNNNGSWTLIPDSDLPGNGSGFGTSPIDILPLDTDTYNEIRLLATFEGTTVTLEHWNVTWGQRVETPVLGDPFDNEKTANTLPVFDFISSDPQGDDLEYELSISTDFNFLTSSSTFNSSVSAGFANQSTPADTNPFNSGDTITYTAQSALTNGTTYWWRARAKDPSGGDAWSPWSEPDSFTVDTAVTVSTWFQTTQEQFDQGTLDGVTASSSGSVVITEEVGEYGQLVVTNGIWTEVPTQLTYSDDMVVAVSLRYSPQGETQRSARVRNKDNDSFEVKADNPGSTVTGTSTIDWVVMRAGDWTLEDGGGGTRVVANTFENVSDVQGGNAYGTSGFGEDVTFSPPFSQPPVVVTSVSTENDSTWVIPHLNDGNTRNNPPTVNGMGLYLGRSAETAVHDPEDIDYIAVERGHGTNNGIEFDADFGSDSHDEAPVTAEPYNSAFATVPDVIVTMQGAEQGGNGAWMSLYAASPPTAANYFPVSDESGDRNHTPEPALTLSFASTSGILVRDTSGGSLTGTIAGENIIFSDGTGPKFDTFSWNDTTPASSDVLYQMQYEVSSGVYALIPDSAIPGNSSGTTTSPIDLTNVDINTYPTIRSFATLSCGGGSCPVIDDWQLEWSEGVNMSGTLQEYDRATNVNSGTIMAAVNGTPLGGSGTVSGGTWTLNNVTAFAGDVVTVWVDGAAEEDEAVAVFVYDGLGDITGVELYEQHLSLSSDETGTTTNGLLGSYDNSVSSDEDIFIDVDISGNLSVCATGNCSQANIYVGPGNTYVASSTDVVTTSAHDFVNDGTIALDGNTFNLSGSFTNNATSSTDTSTINFTATSTSETITSPESPLDFHTLIFGAGIGHATFTVASPLDLSGDLTVASGTFDRGTNDISLEGSLSTGAAGTWLGTATTTFDGAGAKTWSDAHASTSLQNIGNVIIDGATTIVTLLSDVAMYDITIGSNDALSAGSYTMHIAGDFTNTGTFNAGTSEVLFVPDNRTYPPVIPGSQDWYADTNFVDRVPIVVQDSEVSGTLTDFPVYVDLSTLGSDFWNSVQSDGEDIRITSGDGQTELPYDLVEFNSNTDTGELHFLADSLSSSATTTFYLYHNNATATAYANGSTYGRNAVWKDYEAVYHFSDSDVTTGASIVDSSGNGRTMTVTTADLATTSGQMGTALDMDGLNGYLYDSDFSWMAGDRLTVSGWYFMTATDAGNDSLWRWGTAGFDNPGDIRFRPWYGATAGLFYFGQDSGSYAISPRTGSVWRHFMALGATSTSENNLVYEDAVLVETVLQDTANPSNTDGFAIGIETSTTFIDAVADEIRIATTSRNTDWIEAEYSNQLTPTIFYATSSVETYQPPTVIDEATHNIAAGGSAFYNITFNDATTSPAFTEPSIVVNHDFLIATGTVTLPSSKTTIGGSFTNNGNFAHNNSEVEFDGSGAETITLNGTNFLNHFYAVTFDGSGSWTFTDTHATASDTVRIEDGTVTFPGGTLAIGNTLTVNGGGFDANGGTVSFTATSDKNVTTGGSSFNNVVFGSGGVFDWYDTAWSDRVAITIASTSVTETLTDFPVYVDLSTLGSNFWTDVQSDGRDIRVTTADGSTEVPIELVFIDGGADTGQLYFRAPSLTTAADATFYLYYGNNTASAYAENATYGSQNVWTNGYRAVYHFQGEGQVGINHAGEYHDSTANEYDAEDDTFATGTTGYLGEGIEFELGNGTSTGADGSDHIHIPISAIDGEAEATYSVWYQTSNAALNHTLLSGERAAQANAWIAWLNTGTTMQQYTEGSAQTAQTIPNAEDGVWSQYVFTRSGDNDDDEARHYVDGVFEGADTNITGTVIDVDPNGLVIGMEQDGVDSTTGLTQTLDGFVDEVRLSNVIRSDGWVAASYENAANPGSFYSLTDQSLSDSVPVFTLDEANSDADGNVVVKGALLVAPTDTFTIGGSASNIGGSYDANNATTTFDSTDTGETIDFGTGIFYNLSFNGVGGGWTLTTTTVENNATLVTGADFTQVANTQLTVEGVFENSFNSASTTWTGSTLALTGGDYTVTDRLDSGDDYATVLVSNDTDIVIWNSTISTSSISDTSSIYMPDFGTTDGLLHIYGDYERTNGGEYWSYATDFDGTDLSGGSERAATVRIASSSRVVVDGAGTTFEILGISTASTSITSLEASSTYSLIASGTALTAQYLAMQDTDQNGWQLLNSVTLGTFQDARFAIASGTTALTVDASTINNQTSQTITGFSFNRITGSTTNVTASGTPNGYWLFTAGSGDRYGEAFDNDDGDPGSIQWDDSNYSVTFAGVVYSDDGVTPMGAPVCNGTTEVVTVVVDGTTTYTAPCDPADGSYEVTGISYTGEPKIITYLEGQATNGTTTVAVHDELTGSGTVAANTITVTRPDVIDNTVLVTIIGKDDDIVINPPAGWTEIATLGNGTGDDIRTTAWYRVVADAGTEGATYDFSTTDNGEGYSWWIGALVNVDTGTPVDVASSWVKYQNDQAPAASSLTTVTNGALVLGAFYTYFDNSMTIADSDWSARATNVVGGENSSLNVYSQSLSTAGASGDLEAFTVDVGRESHAGQFAIRPAGSPTATGTVTAAVVTQTPLGAGAAYETITLRDQAAGAENVTAGSNLTVDVPDVENGDVLIAVIGKEDDFTITAPAGWTLIDDLGVTAGSDVYSAIWYRVVTNAGSEPATYDFVNNDTSTEELSWLVASYDGVDTSVVVDVATAWSNIQNTSAPTAPAITTVTDGALVLATWMNIADGAMDMPGGSWRTLVEDLGVNQRALSVADQTYASAGLTDAATMINGSTDDVNVGQFALRPAPVSVQSTLSNMDLYQDRVIVRHEDITPLTIADMVRYDNDDDSDIPFTAATSTTDTLDILSGTGLMVWDSKTFIPGGDVTLNGLGTTAADGSFLIGDTATMTISGTDDLTVGGSFFGRAGAVFDGASSTVTFTATNPGQAIGSAASSTFTFYDVDFTGVGGGWKVQTPIISSIGITVATGTVSGVADITVNNGSFAGDGLVTMTGGTTNVRRANTLGGTQGWTFYNLTLGDGVNADITTPGSTATTTVSNVLTIATGHFLDAGSSVWNLSGSGNVFVENGTFLEDTSVVQYSGSGVNILATPYYDLLVDAASSIVSATAPSTGLQVLDDFTIGVMSTATLNVDTNDPLFAVADDVLIGSLGTVVASDSNVFEVYGSWDNNGVFTANGGVVSFLQGAAVETIAAGSSTFATLNVTGDGDFVMTENATATVAMTIGTSSAFTLNQDLTLAVGGTFRNLVANPSNTTWSTTTLKLYSGTAYEINPKATQDDYATVLTTNDTHARFWNSSFAVATTTDTSSIYSMDHNNVAGDLYIFGNYRNDQFADHWSANTDFDGSALPGSSRRPVAVNIEGGGSVYYAGGTLSVLGTSTATTTIDNQGSGIYALTVGGTTTATLNYYQVRDIDADGLTFTGSPSVSDVSYGDFEVAIAGGSAMTVGGTVIDVNQAQNYTQNRFATTTAINAFNVTATGTSVSSWRFVNVAGNLGGEAKDNDPGGDPGYVVWQDSAAIINISGNIYQNDESSASLVCDGSTPNVFLSVAGLSFATTTCAAGTGAYTFSNVGFGPSDTLTVYIDGEAVTGATVTKDPISSISNMDVYENHVIVRHEAGGSMNIAAMSVWDSSDDADIPFTAVDGSPDTLTLPADTKLIIWDDKTFAPNGDVTLSGGGGGADYDGSLEAFTGAIFTASGTEQHSIGGSFEFASDATFTSASSTVTFTTTGATRSITVNEDAFNEIDFTGSGSWTVTDSNLTARGDVEVTAGTLTLPTGTTTLGGNFENTSGSFTANDGLMYFTATDAGNLVRLGGSDAAAVTFSGSGGAWSITDTNATTTGTLTVATGTVTLPSGTLSVGGDFLVLDTLAHNSGIVRLPDNSATTTLTLSGNDLFSLVLSGTSTVDMTDGSVALLGDLTIATGTLLAATNTLSIGGSLDSNTGLFTARGGTFLFNSADTGETVDPGSSSFYNVTFSNAGGGWTMAAHATATNNFTLTAASAYDQQAGTTLYVGNVFTNNVGGSATDWQGSILTLDSGTEYEVNLKSTATELYDQLVLGANTDISFWNSSASTTVTVPNSSSLYSQDHAGADGSLYIYGDYHIATTTEYWSYATDFDGTALGGSPRAVSVAMATSATTTVSNSGSLQMIGVSSATTTVANQGSGTYTFIVDGGTINANYYSFRNLDSSGVQLLGATTITSLDYGDFEQAANSVNLITLASTTLNANASLLITGNRFATGGFTGGVNVNLDATTTNSWTFTGHYGGLDGEDYDVDGSDQCSSVRWDDSACLLTEQTHYRWRNDDGGEGAAPGTWFDGDWGARQRVRLINEDASTYSNTAVKLPVTYDADMQTDFDDLRFTDSNGTTEINYWIERYSAGVSADVWIEVPTLTGGAVTEVFMYYNNVTATTTGSSTQVFSVADDFDDGGIGEYSGDTGLFNVGSTFAYGGGSGLDTSGNESARATDGIFRFDQTVSQGQIIRYVQYIDTTAGANDEACTLFGVQSPGTTNQNYGVCLELFGTDRISLVKDAESTDTFGGVTVLGTSTVSYSTGWYEVEIDWQTDDDIFVTLYDSTGSTVATTSANDSSYSSGGIGFTYWGFNGGWDSYVSWTRTDTKPTVRFGAEQLDGGASWAAAQDTAVGGFGFGEVARLRTSIENTGLPIENQNFRLEFAAKDTAPTCEAVPGGNFVSVPAAGSCGVSAVCMADSASTTDGAATTDHLLSDGGDFIAGEIVENASNESGNIDVDQNEYTELEYAIALTVNAVNDAYCFRVTDGGAALDSYATLAELTLAFDPSLNPVILNNGEDIVLTPGATTTVLATTSVTDLNGFADLATASTTFYRSGVGASCTADNNNCYIAASTSTCSFQNCGGNSCDLVCSADFYYHADPTDAGTYAGEEWFAFMEVEDQAGGYDFGTSIGTTELLTLRALSIGEAINYGILDVNQNTGTRNATTTVANEGNDAIDVDIVGTDMTNGAVSIIPVNQQILGTSTFDYDTCTNCSTLSATGTAVELDLSKPTTDSPPLTDAIYWGIAIPFGTASDPHTGNNTFYATGD